jgi:hypothetical protein
VALDFQKKRAHLSYSECKKRHHPNDSTFQNVSGLGFVCANDFMQRSSFSTNARRLSPWSMISHASSTTKFGGDEENFKNGFVVMAIGSVRASLMLGQRQRGPQL